MFLVLFSYTILFEFKYNIDDNAEPSLNVTLASNRTNKTAFVSNFNVTICESVLLIWVIALISEEFRQVGF